MKTTSTYHATPAHGAPHQRLANTSTTPLTSPTMLVHSVGQPHPPRISPKILPGGVPAASQQSTGASSPNYFGLVVEPASDAFPTGSVPRNNWSSPSSSIKSFAAAVPKQPLPVEVNPAFDAFRSQADANATRRSFALDAPFLGDGTTPATKQSPSPRTLDPTPAVLRRPKSQTHARQLSHKEATNTGSEEKAPPQDSARPSHSPTGSGWAQLGDATSQSIKRSSASTDYAQSMDVDVDASSLHDSAYVSSDSKRNSEASLDPMVFPSLQRFESPSQLDASAEPKSPEFRRDQDSFKDSRNSSRFPLSLGGRLSFPSVKTALPRSVAVRSETAPAKIDTSFDMVDPSQLKEIMEEATSEELPHASLLLLDVRVSAHFAISHIRGALNLCIPTTLLKRATFNLQKMQLTFGKPDEQDQFSAWRQVRHLVVYDSNSYDMRDAVAAANMLRKFTSEGFKGQARILRGGFRAFEAAFPDLIEFQSAIPVSSGPASLALDLPNKRPLSLAPIIGGVVLPSDSCNPSPFFSNIRQNVDLADGVGRMDISLPPNVDISKLPAWLRKAAEPRDHGQRVSERFLQIELAEQARMKRAYTAFNTHAQDTNKGVAGQVQLSGIEKGGKNRYKDILPFEHARVRLRGCAAGACDYVNASHIRASPSFKRYIASQGPLPATFDDFWSMVWDEDVRVIVMLTAESEGGQIKCHPYWTSKEYGPIKLRVLSEKKVSLNVDKYRAGSELTTSATWTTSESGTHSSLETGRRRATTLMSVDSNRAADGNSSKQPAFPPGASSTSDTSFVIIRKFALSHSSHPFSPIREVTQLHYASWPDFGAPAQPSDLLALVELANLTQRASSPVETRTALCKANSSTDGLEDKVDLAGSGSDNSKWAGGKLDGLFRPWCDEPESNANPRPMLVHCSAGCGRTGTFCTIDSVIDMLKRERQQSARLANVAVAQAGFQAGNIGPGGQADGEDTVMAEGGSSDANSTAPNDGLVSHDFPDDLVARTVETFRTQRLSMVQSLRQFVLCYETVTEWLAKTQEHSGGCGGKRGLGRTRSESVRMAIG